MYERASQSVRKLANDSATEEISYWASLWVSDWVVYCVKKLVSNSLSERMIY